MLKLKSMIKVIEDIEDNNFNKEIVMKRVQEYVNQNKKEIDAINRKIKENKEKRKPTTYNLFMKISIKEDSDLNQYDNQKDKLRAIAIKWNAFKANIPDRWYEQNINKYK